MSLDRFIEKQELYYNTALNEIKNGKKVSHWMWYIFPQLKDLGRSYTSKYYGIEDLKEAKAYLENELLREHLMEITSELLKLDGNIESILGFPDNLKLNSSMTLFYYASYIELFKDVVDKFYDGNFDEFTKNIIKK
jgi:uncharacterized protein (DUF1810 family)